MDTSALPRPSEPDEFPRPQGKSIAELRRELGPGGPILSPSVSVLTPGEKNRFGFGLFDRARRQIRDARVAVYLAPVGGGRTLGPFPADSESLAVKPPFQSQGTEADPDAAESVYVAEVPIDRPGKYEILGVVDLDDRLVAADPASPPLTIERDSPVPDVGEEAPRTSTPTAASVGGRLEEITTRVPPARELHDVDFANVVGERPVVLVFATPALCQSRVCGPVVDVALQVASEHPEAEFVHMEIYEDNVVEKGFRPQVAEWNLPTEPWAFAVDRDGRIVARLEGAFSPNELEAAVEKAARS